MPIPGKIVTASGEDPNGDLQNLQFDANGNLLVKTLGDAVRDPTNSNISPTESDVTAQVNYRYFVDLSGLTANRSLIIPAGSVGDRIILSVTVPDALYSFTIKGAAGVTIAGGSAATEWSRLFIKNETIELVANTTSNWQIINDGRIASYAKIKAASTQSIVINASVLVACDTIVSDDYNMANVTASNYKITVRRNNKYLLLAKVTYESGSLYPRAMARIAVNTVVQMMVDVSVYDAASFPVPLLAEFYPLDSTDTVQLHAWQSGGDPLNIIAGSRLSLKEQF